MADIGRRVLLKAGYSKVANLHPISCSIKDSLLFSLAAPEDSADFFKRIITDYSQVFQYELHMNPGPPKHGPPRPIKHRPRRLRPEKRAVAKKEFQELEKMGICYRSSPPWAAPLLTR